MNVDYILVGLGLAGLAFSEELLAHNKSFIVFEDNSQTASLVAGGIYNPVILKRFTPVWNGHTQLQIALPFYKRIANRFNQEFDRTFSTKKVLKSIEDENNWFTALDKPGLSPYMKPQILRKKINGIVNHLGFGVLTGTGRIDTKKLIETYRKFLQKEQKIQFKKFDYANLKLVKNQVEYQEIKAKKIVFTEGFGVKKNPFFKEVPLQEAKGELITIYAPNLNIDFLLKSTLFVLPLGNYYYKVGATFNWIDTTPTPTLAGKEELIQKLKKVLTVPYTIIDQSAGIRPTVKDRRPLVGTHCKHQQLAILNGLGTRGVMIAPTIAKQLFNHLEKGTLLDKDIDVNRFNYTQ